MVSTSHALTGLAMGLTTAAFCQWCAARLPAREWQASQQETRDGVAMHFPQADLHQASAIETPTPTQRLLATLCAWLTGLLVLAIALTLPWTVSTLIIAISIVMLGIIAAIDCRYFYCPDQLSFPLMALGLWYHLTGHGSLSALDAFYGMLAGYLFFRVIASAYRLIRHRDGLGGGDAKLLAIAGAWLGWQALPAVVALSASAGCVVGGLLLLRRKINTHTPLPFGPFIIAAGIVVMRWNTPNIILSAMIT